MSIEFKRVGRDFSLAKELDEIIRRQFPPSEYMPLEKQLELQDSGGFEIWALYSGEQLAGFTSIRTSEKIAYLFLLAFDDEFQGKGFGSEVVKLLAKIYSEKIFAVDFEMPIENFCPKCFRLAKKDKRTIEFLLSI